MLNNLKNLMNDEHGFVVSAELILISTIAVLGLMVGLVEVRQRRLRWRRRSFFVC